MGLDMYLFRRKKGNAKQEDEEVMYWRKANHIRGWFINRCEDFNPEDNCQKVKVEKTDLEALVRQCDAALNLHRLLSEYKDTKEEKWKALKEKGYNQILEIFPIQEGFFFGASQVEDWYWEDLEDTLKGVTKVLKETDWDGEEVYYYDWW